ncbi:MAG: phosphodiester glycosidase family protein [Bacteroidaceae bacterium]|nr:phosphodiester glycosidase family protein [Bacteroidaceae bacterium]
MKSRSSITCIMALMCALQCVCCHAQAQTVQDSLAIVSAWWETKDAGKGIVGRRAAFSSLYGSPQYVSVVEINPGKGHRAAIAVSPRMTRITRLAEKHGAKAAINGSYFDMKKGNSTCYLSQDGELVDTTRAGEFKIRVTGAVVIQKGKVRIQPWTKDIEKGYKKKKRSVLASGPLMLQNGRYADWSGCSASFVKTKHPRSAIAVTKDKRVLLITVDGRFPGKAAGMSIPELAHLAKVLGGTSALNLDGGGSTTLYMDGEVLNHPTDNRTFDHAGERGIPNMIYYQ